MALKTCRCCCATIRLEKAAKVIGIVFTILGAISAVSFAVKLYQMDSGHDQLVSDLNVLFPQQDAEGLFYHSRSLLVVRLCMVILFTLFSALLVAGVYRNSRSLVLAFVIFYGLYLAISTIGIFYAFYDPTTVIDEAAIAPLQKESADTAKAVIYIVLAVMLAVCAFLWYLAAVVYSYYKEMARSGPTTEHRQLF